MTKARPSLAWDIPAPLTPEGRIALGEALDAVFSDENDVRPHMIMAPDVHVVVAPHEHSYTVVVHFLEPVAGTATREDWIASWVLEAVRDAGFDGPLPAPRTIRTGMSTPAT